MSFKIKIEKEAKQDIQDAISWYNKKEKGLGRKFHAEVKEYLQILVYKPKYQVRYDQVRCLPLKRFPFMLHFTVDAKNKIVTVRAVLNTARDPKIWLKRKK